MCEFVYPFPTKWGRQIMWSFLIFMLYNLSNGSDFTADCKSDKTAANL